MATINTNLAGVTSGSQYASAGNNTIYTNLPFNTAGTTATNVTFIVGASASIDILYNQNFRVDSTVGFHELFGNIEVQGVSSDYTVSSWYGKVQLTHKTTGQVISFQLTKPQNAASNSGVNVEFLDGALAFTSNVNAQGVWTVWATQGGTDTSTWGAGGLATQVPGTFSPGATPLDLSVASDVGYLNYSVNSSDVTNWGGQATDYTLTVNPETINVPAGQLANIFGTVVNGGTSTLTAADVINGGGDLTTLSVTAQNSGAAAQVGVADVTNGASLNNIGTIQVRNVTADAGGGNLNNAVLNASLVSGLKQVTSNISVGGLVVNNLASGTSVGVTGNGVTANGTSIFNYVNGASASTLDLVGGTTGGTIFVNGNGILSATVNSTGATNTISTLNFGGVGGGNNSPITSLTINATSALVAGDGVTSSNNTLANITVQGSATNTTTGNQVAVDLGGIAASVESVNASGLTAGGIGAGLNSNAPSTFTLVGGAGNDYIVTTGILPALVTGAVNGGAGTADVLNVTGTINNNQGAVLTATTGKYFTGFEVLRNSQTNNNIAVNQNVLALTGITNLQTNAANAGFVNMTGAQAANLQILTTTTGATFSLADASGSSDALTLNLRNLSAANTATVINAIGLTTDGFETINIVSNSGSSTSLQTAGTTYNSVSWASGGSTASLKNIAATGAYNLDVNVSANATSVTSIDLSGTTNGGNTVTLGANTGKLTVTGSNASDTITLATLGGGGSATINTGSGNDTIIGTQAQIAAVTISGSTGTDKLSFSSQQNTLTVVDATFANVSGIDAFSFAQQDALAWTVGGFANSLATAANGVLNVTATNLLASGLTLDASALSGTNALNLTAGQTLNNAGQGGVSIISSKAGADSITIGTFGGGGASSNNITVDASANTSAGVTIDASNLNVAFVNQDTATLKGGSGADTIKSGVVKATIIAGAGADTIILGTNHTGVQTLVISNTDSTTTTFDSVTNFGLKTGGFAGDVIDYVANVGILASGNYNAVQTGIANLTASVADLGAGNSSGVIVFGGSAAAGLSLANAITAATTLINATGVAGSTAAFNYGGTAYVVEYTGTANTMVALVGTTATDLDAASNNLVIS